ncbi:serine/threonine-protein kinase [Sphaerisporangium corydalis]|uniref:Serine/threonine-protein kinase n=1 Tax=Sphaerisporangium corydalis TaxID=1441875 RepID=A0ABV9ENK1_9ACTN|nr:serine/threonine-protein kinase [Sphaerisporangium corydalis]
MTTQPGQRLVFLDVRGVQEEATVTAVGEDPLPVGSHLRSRSLTLEYVDGTPNEVLHLSPELGRSAGYDALDNEILAGLRLSRLCGSYPYPSCVSRLLGYEAHGEHPFALLAPYRGEPVGSTGGRILPTEKSAFQRSLLAGVRWVSAAGIAHRALSPFNVHWDGMSAQITGFSDATIAGAPRAVVGVPPWQAPEQRPGQVNGAVTDKDDVWAAGRLIYYVSTGRDLVRGDQVCDEPDLAHLLGGIFGPIGERPSVRELLDRLNLADPVPRLAVPDTDLRQWRAEFLRLRACKHPHTVDRDKPSAPSGTTPKPSEPPRRRRRLWR